MIILLNGPPRSGKDTVAKFIKKHLFSCEDYKMTQPLRKAFVGLMGIKNQMTSLLLEDHKDEKIWSEFDYTPRDILIAVSEELMKPRFGDDIMGVLAVQHMSSIIAKHIVVPCGFVEEIKPIRDWIGWSNVRAIQIRRPGCNYDNDSRSDIDFDSLDMVVETLNNQHDLELLEQQVIRILRKWELINE